MRVSIRDLPATDTSMPRMIPISMQVTRVIQGMMAITLKMIALKMIALEILEMMALETMTLAIMTL